MKKVWKHVVAILIVITMLFTEALIMEKSGSGNCITIRANAETISEFARGDVIEFGWYPQSRVTNTGLINALNEDAGEWKSYGYYVATKNYSYNFANGNMQPSDFMQFKDVLLGESKYRGVRFSAFRPKSTDYTLEQSLNNNYQYNDGYRIGNGYNIGTVYWFKYDPVQWYVINPQIGWVLCKTIIDSQPFNNYVIESNGKFWGDSRLTYYANNYTKCSLRNWLNEDFYNTAFSPTQQDLINVAKLDNFYSGTGYYAETTNDKVFLLAWTEAHTIAGGNDADFHMPVAELQAKGSDYAKAQGLRVNDNSYSNWWLRSFDYLTSVAHTVNENGCISYENDLYLVNETYFGVRPSLCLKLHSEIIQSDVSDLFEAHDLLTTTVAPTCTEPGCITTSCSHCDYKKIKVLPEIGHKWDAGIITTDATCTETGIRRFTCQNDSSHTKTETIPTKEHTYESVITAPTCTEKGFTTYTCSACGDNYTSNEKPANGHSYEAVITAPTCTEIGFTTYICSACGDRYTADETAAAGHSFGAWKQTKAPTVYAEGVETQYCANCTATNTRSIPKLPMPKVKIQNFTASSKAYDYRSSITFKADVDNKLPNGQIHWFVDGKEVGTGDTYTAENVKQSFSLQAKCYVDGKEIPEAATDVEKVNVNTGFFAKLKAFFRGLFGLLPKVTQEYLGVEFIDHILPD